MKLSDLNIAKTNREIESINARLDEMMECLSEREKVILDAIEAGKQTDLATGDIIKKQDQAIAKLESLNNEKSKTLTGMTKWIILIILGVLSLTVRYNVEYYPGKGAIVKPDANSGPILPTVYALAIIAIASGNDEKLGLMLETVGKKISG